MIPCGLTAPIPYEHIYSSSQPGEIQRFEALDLMLTRLDAAQWLNTAVHSVHLIDWDWRYVKPEYNHNNVPMRICTREVFDWYREYGAFLQLDQERAHRFSFARFFLELTRKRDIVEVRFDLTGSHLFEISKQKMPSEMDMSNDPGWPFFPDKIVIRLNLRIARRLCSPLLELLELLRRKNPAKEYPLASKSVSLANVVGDACWVNSELASSTAAERARSAYLTLPDKVLDSKIGSQWSILLNDVNLPEGESGEHTARRYVQVLLANLAVQAFLVPDSLRESTVLIVPGVVQIHKNVPIAGGAFLIHCPCTEPRIRLTEWLALATTWAREKATFDLGKRAKDFEQRRALALANHILKNPLLSASSLARKIEAPREIGSAMLSVIAHMRSLYDFVKCACEGTKESEYCVKDTKAFLESFSFSLRHLCEILDGDASTFSAMARHVARGNCLFDVLRPKGEKDFLPPGVMVRWSQRQMFCVMDGLISNALKHNIRSCSATMGVFLDCDRERIFLNVQSTCNERGDKLRQLLCDLNHGGNTDWIGINLIHLATKACAEYAAPYWRSEEDSRILARVQIACIQGGTQ